MLFTMQFPFADCRRFAPGPTGLIRHPSWPSPLVKEFVRSFGGVRERLSGGVAFWGENYVCDAHGAIGFKNSIPPFTASDGTKIPLEVAFRRLYCDGLAVGKFEVGLATAGRGRKLDRGDVKNFLSHLLSAKVQLDSKATPFESMLAEA